MQKKYWLALFAAAACLLFFGNADLLVTDSVESNYALTAREMVLSGDWLSPQIYGQYWYDKPVFFYWLTALAFKLFGFTEFAARFFPALFGLAGLGLAAYGGTRLFGARTGFYSAAVLLSSVEFFLISKSIITDAVLFFFFSATLLFFYLAYRDDRTRDWLLMYAAAGCGVLTKGPVAILLPGLVITLFLIWQRDWRVLGRARLGRGLLLCAAIALPWYAAMYRLHGSEFLEIFFGVHNFLRATVSEHPRDNVWYYYLCVNALALFPWSGLVPLCLWRAWRRDAAESERFLLLWAGVIFLFFQCMATKYITYTYPLLFPMSIYLARQLADAEERLLKPGYFVFMGSVFAALLGAAFWVKSTGRVDAENIFLLPLSLIIGMLLYYLWQLGGTRRVLGVGSLCLVFYLSLISAIAIPLSEQRSAKNLAELLARLEAQEAGVYGAYPTSAVFYSGARLVKLVPQEDLARLRPREMSWTSKNVMPMAARESWCSGAIIWKDDEGRWQVKRDYAG